MSLVIGKRYLITTNKETILKKPVEVVSRCVYNIAQKEPYNIINLAINEKIITENDDMNYLKSIIYYKCIGLDGKNETIILWDDIINFSRVTELSVTYEYETMIDVDDNSKLEINEVVNFIINSVKEKYGKNVNIEMTVKGKYGSEGESESDAEKLDKFRASLDEAFNVLNILNNTKASTEELIKKITEMNLNTNISTISADVEKIKGDMAYIRSNISGV